MTAPSVTPLTRPRFPRGLATVPYPDGLLVDGAPERQVFRGAAARDLLPKLLPLLDGTRAADRVAAEAGVSEQAVRAALALLDAAGLVEDAPAEPESVGAPVDRRLVDYLGRNLDRPRVHPNGETAAAVLAQTRLALVGDPDRVAELALALTDCSLRPVLLDRIDEVGDGLHLVVAVDADGQRVDRACRAAGVPWLRVAVRGECVELGPRFEAGVTACHACFAAGRPVIETPAPAGRAAIDGPSPAAPGVARSTGDDDPATGWAALAAMELVAALTRIGTAGSLLGMVRLDLAAGLTETFPLVRRGSCPACSPGPGQPAHLLGYAFEQAVAAAPRHLADPRAAQQLHRAGQHAPQHEFLSYPYAPLVPLPDSSVDALPTSAPPLDRLAAVLRAVTGLKHEQDPAMVLRVAPTGGNLGSPQCYLISAGGAPAGAAAAGDAWLPPGVHYYDPREHALATLSPVCPAVTPAPPAGGALIVLTAALPRLTQKYQLFALRLILLDAGVAAWHAVAVAQACGLRVAPVARWDDEALRRGLGIDPDNEPITAVLTLERT